MNNLSDSKLMIRDYYESGNYENDLHNVIEQIKKDFEEWETGLNDAVIFDVDETTLSNYEFIKSIDFGYEIKIWNNYLFESNASAIKPVLELYKWFLSKNIRIIFLTGREAITCEATKNNLIEVGYEVFDTLICRNSENKNTKAEIFKTEERKNLTEDGYNIIATIGDLYGDIEGDYTGRKYKLPNYIYSF
jgi:acid phosphatase